MTTKRSSAAAAAQSLVLKHEPMGISRLGACDDVVDLLSQSLVQVPATLYRVNEMELPLGSEFASEFFGSNIALFAGSESNQTTGVSANSIITNASAQPFILRCVAPYVAVEALGFSANGAAMPFPGTPAVDTPAFDGVIQLGGGPAALQQAWFEYGQSTWKAAKDLFQAYRLNMPLGNTFILFDELVADVGTTDAHNTWGGFSDSLVGLPEYIRQLNDRQRALGAAATPQSIFVPATTQNLGTQQAQVIGGVPTPLASASWGGPCMKGLFGGCYPSRGVVFPPAMPIYLNLSRDSGDSLYYNDLIASVTNRAGFTYDENLTGTVTGATTGSASFVKFVGGKLRVGATMRGANLTPRAVIEWYAMMSGMYGDVYRSTMCRDWMDGLSGVSSLLGLSEGERVTALKRSDLLNRLAKARTVQGKGAKQTKSYETLSFLAGVPGIDDKEPSEATRVFPKGLDPRKDW